MNTSLKIVSIAISASCLLASQALATTITGGGMFTNANATGTIPGAVGVASVLGGGSAQWFTDSGGRAFEVAPPVLSVPVPPAPRPPGYSLMFGRFTVAPTVGIFDLSSFVPFLPDPGSFPSSDGLTITDAVPFFPSPVFAPGQLLGTIDDDPAGPTLNSGFAGAKVYLVVTIPGSVSSSGFAEGGIFSSSLTAMSLTGMGTNVWTFPTFAGDLTDDIILDQNDINQVFFGTGVVGGGIMNTLATTENALQLAAIPEPSRALLGLLGVVMCAIRRRR